MSLRRTPMPPRRTPLERRRRAFIVSAFHAASVAPRRRSKTSVGEFTRKQRQTIYDRFQGRCAVDGDWINPQDCEIQHRRARGMGGSRDPIACSLPAGVALHSRCHRSIEENPDQALRDGYRVRQGQHPRDWPMRIWTGASVLLDDRGGYREVSQ